MAKEFNLFDIIYVNRMEYREKLARLCLSLILGTVLLVALVAIISAAHQLLTDGRYGFLDLLSRHLYAFVTGNYDTSIGSEIIPFPVVVIEATAGLLASFVIAGVIAILVSRSVNPIEICDLSVIHTDGSDKYGQEIDNAEPCYEFRYFVKLPDGVYLRNAFASISIMDEANRTVGKGVTRTLFKFEEHYEQIRGVRFLSVPLSTKDDNNVVLKEALSRYMHERKEGKSAEKAANRYRYIVVARVGGIAPNGEQVSSVKILLQSKLADGCKFASIRHSTCMGEDLPDKGIEYIYFAHFNKLYSCSNGAAMGFSWGDEVKKSILEGKEIRPSAYDRARNLTRKIAACLK